MRNNFSLLAVAVSLVPLAAACNPPECGDGTIERDGECVPATLTTQEGDCGPFTELVGDRCVPQFPPTECDPATTTPMTDPDTGVTTCIGTGGGGCGAPFACPTPTQANRLTVCGQLFDVETNLKFQIQDATSGPCTAVTTSGPCALSLVAIDAAQFAAGNPTPLPVESTYIDDCGRYRLVNIDISTSTSPFVGIGVDDAGGPFSPMGVTVTTGVAVPKTSPVVTDMEAWIVKGSTYAQWAMSGGPTLNAGIYFAAYRKHKLAAGVNRHTPQPGVTFAHATMGPVSTAEDFYFLPAQLEHRTIDPTALVTGANGSALITNRSLAQGGFTGVGGLGTGCRWEPHAAANVPGVVFFQVYRKADLPNMPGSCMD